MEEQEQKKKKKGKEKEMGAPRFLFQCGCVDRGGKKTAKLKERKSGNNTAVTGIPGVGGEVGSRNEKVRVTVVPLKRAFFVFCAFRNA